jgi:hypothetical protein
MYRRAEMRAQAESSVMTDVIVAAPVELPADAPSFSAPDIVAAIGHVDPVVRTIMPLSDTVPYAPCRPTSHQANRYGRHTPVRRHTVILATIAVGIIGVIWFARPTPTITAPAPTAKAAPVAVVQPVSSSTPSIVQSPPAPSASTAPGEPPARPRALDPVLRITSDPAGARVTVNGVGWGSTPVAIRNLPPGPKTIRVTKDGYVADQRLVSFSGASPSSVQLRLRRTPSSPAASTAAIRPR